MKKLKPPWNAVYAAAKSKETNTPLCLCLRLFYLLRKSLSFFFPFFACFVSFKWHMFIPLINTMNLKIYLNVKSKKKKKS